METAVIYARYSSDNQTEQSIEGQLRVCKEYAKSRNIAIVNTYIDRAMTGTNDNRPDFQRMIRDSSNKLWDYVIVYKLDRFSRNKYEATIHKHTLNNNGVKLISAMERIPDTPEGIILESLLEGMNQYYSAELSQKVQRGLNESYLKGLNTGGHQIYGYDVCERKNVINEEESKIVQEIFSKFAQGFTGVDIANNLRDRGIRTKRGDLFTDKKVYKIISNIKYTGKVQHGETVYTNIYPAIIDDNIWQQVQTIRKKHKHAEIRKRDVCEYILSGKLHCGYCKHNIIGDSGKEINKVIKYRYYACLTKRRRKDLQCKLQSTKKQKLENEIIDITWKVLSNNNNLKKIAKSIIDYQLINNEAEIKIKSIERSRNELVKASQNIIKAIEMGIITEQTKLRLTELESQIAEHDILIEQEKSKNFSFLTEDLIMDYFKKIICGDIENQEIRKQIVKVFIRDIILYNDKVVIFYNFTNNGFTTSSPDDIIAFDLEKEELKLLTEKTINESVDISIFYSKEYFAVIEKRNK